MSIQSLGPKKAIPLQKSFTPEELNEQIKGVSKTYEQQFLREMVKAMRSTVGESSLVNVSQGEKIFREQLDQEYADQWGNKGGIGLADLIYDQIMNKYGAQMGIRPQMPRPNGPIEIKDQDQFKIKTMTKNGTSDSDFGLDLALERKSDNSKEAQIANLVAPWRAEVLGSEDLGGGLTSVTLGHEKADAGFSQSSYIFQGVPQLKSQFLNAGESFATISPEARLVNWRLRF